MKFRRVHSQYDRAEQRAYVEARALLSHGGAYRQPVITASL
ncbi:MAG: hypothetical protein PVI61_12990 [Methyloceanibacter sp.]